MTLNEIGIVVGITVPLVTGAGAVGKLYGDTVWVPIGAYQKEKLYDLEDKAFEYELQEKYEGSLEPREREQYERLLKRIERLQLEIQ